MYRKLNARRRVRKTHSDRPLTGIQLAADLDILEFRAKEINRLAETSENTIELRVKIAKHIAGVITARSQYLRLTGPLRSGDWRYIHMRLCILEARYPNLSKYQ